MDSQIENINLTYRGNDVDRGLIDIEDLSDGLIGFKDCFNRIKKISNITGEHHLKIKGFEKGSFKVCIEYILDNKEWMFPMIITGIPTLIVAIIQLRKTTKGRTHTKEDLDKITISGENINIEGKDLIERILQDPSFNRSLQRITRPLKKDEIDIFEIDINKKISENIKYDEKEYFSYLSEKEITTKRTNLAGVLRAWDKKTNNGKFVTQNKTLPCSFEMENPQDFYEFFQHEGQVNVECELEMNKDLEISKIMIFDIHKQNDTSPMF